MKIARRHLLYLGAGVAVAQPLPQSALALSYPMRPFRMIVPFAPAGGTDILARLLGQWLSERFGQPFVIDNRPGAASSIGTEVVVHAPPDGYTLLLADASAAINASLYDKLSFNFIRDISPVAAVISTPLLMVANPTLPARTIAEFIAYAKASPGRINMASAGTGSTSHLAGELFKMMTGIAMTHAPYRGGGATIPDLIAGQVQVSFSGFATAAEYVKAGKLRGLAVTTMARSEALPELPSAGEFLTGYEVDQWYGLCAPKNVPAKIVNILNQEINAALADFKMKARLAEQGGTGLSGSPADFGKLISRDTEKWAKVVKFAGIKAG
jgi:tripartite-type tricarboxylate transporter receptor subunit TctC